MNIIKLNTKETTGLAAALKDVASYMALTEVAPSLHSPEYEHSLLTTLQATMKTLREHAIKSYRKPESRVGAELSWADIENLGANKPIWLVHKGLVCCKVIKEVNVLVDEEYSVLFTDMTHLPRKGIDFHKINAYGACNTAQEAVKKTTRPTVSRDEDVR